ncbi:DUF4402 domain-containing protein [Pseudomonadota bacterium]
MTTTRAYSWTFKAAAALVAAEMAFCVPLYVDAASTSAGASVRITAQPSALGTISIFQVKVAKPGKGTKAIDATPTAPGRSANAPGQLRGDTIQPAVFSISGLPDQAFAIVMPKPGITTSARGSVEFMDFSHDAGGTPTIGSDGSTQFAVGARMKFTPVAVNGSSGISVSNSADQSQDQSEGDFEVQSGSDGKLTPAQKIGLSRPNPFGTQGIEDGFMSVLVSYN